MRYLRLLLLFLIFTSSAFAQSSFPGAAPASTQTGAAEELKYDNVNGVIEALNYGTLGTYATTTVSGTVNQPATAFPLVSVTNLTTNRWISIAGAGGSCGSNWNSTFPNPSYTCPVMSSGAGAVSLATVGAPQAWTASHLYTIGQIILPTSNNAGAFEFEVTAGGTSNNSQPTWSATCNTPGQTCTDSGVTWTNIGASATTSWDYQYALWDGDGGLGQDMASVQTITTGPVWISPATATINSTITYPTTSSVPGVAVWRAPHSPGGQWALVALCPHQVCRDEGVVRTILDGNTNGTTTFTSSQSGSFTTMDINKPIYCVDGSNNPLDVNGIKITAVAGPNSLTLASVAGGTHSNIVCHIGRVNDLAIPETPPAAPQSENLRARITSIVSNTVNLNIASATNVTNANVWTDEAGMLQQALNDAENVSANPGFGPHVLEMACLQSTQNPAGNTCQYRMGSSLVWGKSATNVRLLCTGGGFDARLNGAPLWIGSSQSNNPALQIMHIDDCNVQGVGATVPASATNYPLQDGTWVLGVQGVTFKRFTINSIPHDGFVSDKPGTSGGFATKEVFDIRVRNTGYHGFMLGFGHTLDDYACDPYCFQSASGQQVNGGSSVGLAGNIWNGVNPIGFVDAIDALGTSGVQGYFVHNSIQHADGGKMGFHEEQGGNINGGQGIRLASDEGLLLQGLSFSDSSATSFVTDGLFFASNNKGVVVTGASCDGGTHVMTNCINLNNATGGPTVLGVTFDTTPPTGALVANIPVDGIVSTLAGFTAGQLGFNVFYSAAGTAIPACSSSYTRQLACVKDETSACTGGNTYASGGTNKCQVQCDGTNWKVNSVLCYGS